MRKWLRRGVLLLTLFCLSAHAFPTLTEEDDLSQGEEEELERLYDEDFPPVDEDDSPLEEDEVDLAKWDGGF